MPGTINWPDLPDVTALTEADILSLSQGGLLKNVTVADFYKHILIQDATALRALTPVNDRRVYLKYHTSSGDGGYGWFRGVTGAAAATYTHDNGVTFVPSGGDGSAAWVREHSGIFNVKWFGAVGDGATDDTTAFQAFSDALDDSGQHYSGIIPESIYIVNGWNIKITGVNSNRIVIRGEGIQNTIIRGTATTGNTVTIDGSLVTLEDLEVDSSAARTAGTSGHGIFMDAGGATTQSRITLRRVSSDGNPDDGIHAVKPELHTLEDVWADNNGNYGIYYHDGGASIGINNYFKNIRCSNNGDTGFRLKNIISNTAINVQCITNGGSEEMFIQSGTGSIVINPDVERTTFDSVGIRVSGSFHEIHGGTIQKVATGIVFGTALNCTVYNPRLVGDAGTPTATGISIDSNSTDCLIKLQRSPSNVTTRISDSGVNTSIITGSEFKNVDVIPTRQIFSATTPIVVDVELGLTIQQTLTQATTVGAPSNSQIGQTLIFIMIQDGTGGWNVTWNSIYKFNTAWSDAGNSASTRSQVVFNFDGASWRQVGTQATYI